MDRTALPSFRTLAIAFALWSSCIVAGLTVAATGIDFHIKSRAHATLQDAAEVTARAALTTRLMLNEDAARGAARAIIRRHDGVRDGKLLGGTIDFGRVDAETGAFLPEAGAGEAVRVVVWGPRAGRPGFERVFRRFTGEPSYGKSVEHILVADPARCGDAPVCPVVAKAPGLLFSAR